MNVDDREAAGDDDRAEVGNRVEDPGEQPPDDEVVDAEPPQRQRRSPPPTIRLVITWTRRKPLICWLISSMIWTLIFFFVSVGPAIFTIFRL